MYKFLKNLRLTRICSHLFKVVLALRQPSLSKAAMASARRLCGIDHGGGDGAGAGRIGGAGRGVGGGGWSDSYADVPAPLDQNTSGVAMEDEGWRDAQVLTSCAELIWLKISNLISLAKHRATYLPTHASTTRL